MTNADIGTTAEPNTSSMRAKYPYFALAALFTALALTYIKVFAVNVLNADDLDLAYSFIVRGFSLKDISSLGYGHLDFILRLVIYTITSFTNYNVTYVMYFSMLLYIVGYLSLVSYYYKNISKSLLIPFLVGIVLLSPRQWEIFLVANSVGYAIVLCFTILGCILFQSFCQRDGTKRYLTIIYLLSMILCCLITTFSSAQGLSIWFSIILIWILHDRKKAFIDVSFYVFILCALLVLLFFSINVYKAVSPTLDNSSLFDNPSIIVHFYLLFIGNIASTELVGTFILFFTVIILADFIRFNKTTDIIPVCLIASGLIAGLMLVVGRGSIGPRQSGASRYLAMSVPIVLGCLLYLPNKDSLSIFSKSLRLDTKFVKTVFILFVILLTTYFIIGTRRSLRAYNMNNLYNFYYQTADSQPLENIGQFYFGNVDHVQKIIKALKENHLFVYSESEPLQNVPQLPLPETLPPDQNLVLLNQVEFVDAPDDPYLLISGAAIDPDRKSKLSSVYVILNDLKFASYYGTENSFTTKIARRKVNLNAGFARAIPLRLLPNGTYSLKVRLLSADKTALYESPSLLTLIKDTNTINISNTFNY